MDLALLKLFAQVAEAGSLSRPAQAAGIAQSVVSRRIAALEQELGGKLFHRTGHGVALTEVGERTLPRVHAILLEAARLAEDVHGSSAVVRGDVRMGMLTSMVHPLVGELYRIVRAELPGVRLHVLEGTGGQLEQWLAGDDIDIGILPRRQRAGASETAHLLRIALHLVGPAGDPLTRRPTVRFARLNGLPLVLPAAPSALQRILKRAARQQGVTLSVAMEADSLTIQKEMAATAGVYTILGVQAMRREMREGTLQGAKIVDPVIERDIVLTTGRKKAQLSPAVMAVAKIATRIARGR
jgi:DNA-binding transcriptional LysR family regulator